MYAGRDLDHQVADACTGHREPPDSRCRTTFPRMVRVRTVDEIDAMLDTARRTTA